MKPKLKRDGYKRHGPVSLVLKGIAMLVLLVPVAVASPCKNNPDHPNCTGGGGDGVFTPVDVTAGFYQCDPAWPDCELLEEAWPWDPDTPHPLGWDNWTENTLEVVPRPCFTQTTETTESFYQCRYEDAIGGRVSLDISSLIWAPAGPVKKNQHPEFCSLLNEWEDWDQGGTVMPGEPLRYGVTYYVFNNLNEGCTSDSCMVTVHNNSFNNISNGIQRNPFINLTGLGYLGITDENDNLVTELPDPGGIIVRAMTDGMVDFDLAENELNIFTKQQTLRVETLRIEFQVNNAPGRALAVCETIPPVDNLWFLTEPLVPGWGSP